MSQLNPPKRRSKSHVTLTFDRALTEAEVVDLKLATNALVALRVPAMVQAAYDREQQLRFKQSSEPEVGRLLSVFAAMVPPHGRVLELGTGAGVGLAWIVHGLNHRNDVEVVSVEHNREQAVLVQAAGWPKWVSVVVGDSGELIGMLGSFDLIFPDTPGGKIYNLQATIAALRPGGALLLDDMEVQREEPPERIARVASVRNQLFGDPDLICTELAVSSGMIVAVRQRSSS
jgi:demethylmenaquinone methyltransferase/2-methoxy-6-polyprenyl-1,4-benzoquinol methylase